LNVAGGCGCGLAWSEEAVDASGEDDDEKVVVVEAVQDLICHHKSHNHNHRSDSLLPLE
jgi:hypothetical protein